MEGTEAGVQDKCKVVVWHVTEGVENSTALENIMKGRLPLGTRCNAFCAHSGVASARRITVLIWVQIPVTVAALDDAMKVLLKCSSVVKHIDYPSKEETLGKFIGRAVATLGSDVLGRLAADPLEEIFFSAEVQRSGIWLVGVKTIKRP